MLASMLDDPDGEEGGKAWWTYTWFESLFFSGQCLYEDVIPPNIIEIKNKNKWQLVSN